MYNYYNATFTYATARRVQQMGIPVRRKYGYYVLISPPVMNQGRHEGTERVECWCKTKAIAQKQATEKVRCQKRGYYSCPCGSEKQAVACCGIPSAS